VFYLTPFSITSDDNEENSGRYEQSFVVRQLLQFSVICIEHNTVHITVLWT